MTTQRHANTFNESFYAKIGSTWFLDGTFAYLISPMGFIGFFLNIICLLIFFKVKIKSKNENLVKYLRIYSIVSSFICLIMGFTFIAFSPRYFSYIFEKYSAYFKCKIFNYLLGCLYQYGISIDFLIALDCISSHSSKLMFMKKINPYLVCSSNLLLYLIINYPLNNFYRLKLISYTELEAENCSKLFLIRHNRIQYLIIALQDVLPTILMTLAILMSSYFRVKNTKKLSSINSIIRSDADSKKILLLCQTLCLNTLISHLIILIGRYIFICFLMQFNNMVSYVYITCMTCFIVCFKHSINIFLFYLCDSRFKENFINFNRRNYIAQYL
jgi:hypothetical protein